MEALSEVLADIEAAGLLLAAEGNELIVRAGKPGAAFTPQIRQQLTAHKPALLALLRQRQLQEGVKNMLVDALVSEAEVAKSYETKATMPGQTPPYERVLAQQEWLASIDWSRGLRCGLTRQQCRVCKGIPCEGSSEW